MEWIARWTPKDALNRYQYGNIQESILGAPLMCKLRVSEEGREVCTKEEAMKACRY